MTMRGARRRQQAVFVLGEAIAAVIPGALAGLAVGAVAVALIAHRAGVPSGDALGHGLLTPTAVALAVGGAIGAIVAVVFALRSVDGRRARGVRPIDMAAVGAVVALALLLIRGQGSASSLGSGPAIALAATPLLASFAFCVLLGRVLEPALRVALRSARSGPSTLLIALLTLHRSPGRTAGLAGFLAVSAGLAMFALSYRSTLATSSSERAAYQVPLDYTLSIGPALESPQDVASLARFRSLAPGVGAWPVLRQTAEVAGSGTRPATPTVLGVPAAAFPLIHGWRSDFSSQSPAALGRLLQPPKAIELAGATIPDTATRLELPAVLTGPAIQPVLVVQTRSGGADELLPQLATGGAQRLAVAVPPADRGGKIVALRLDLPSAVQKSSAHQQAEGHNGGAQAFAGTLRLEELVAVTDSGRVPVTSFGGWNGQGGITATHNAHGVRTDFAIDTSETALLRPVQPFDSRVLPGSRARTSTAPRARRASCSWSSAPTSSRPGWWPSPGGSRPPRTWARASSSPTSPRSPPRSARTTFRLRFPTSSGSRRLRPSRPTSAPSSRGRRTRRFRSTPAPPSPPRSATSRSRAGSWCR
jgi:hypothetical protein